MNSLNIQGGIPLNGEVNLSGSSLSASKIILASLFTTEDVILSNVPHVTYVKETLELIKALGAEYEWLDNNKLQINTAGVSSSRIPFELGSHHQDTFLVVAPLIFRFGKAIVPQPKEISTSDSYVEPAISTWESLGMKVSADQEWIKVEPAELEATNLSFKEVSPFNTINAIFSSLFIHGKTVVTNSAEEEEVEDLINFVCSLGAQVTRTEPRRIEIEGENLFKGTSYTVQNETDEAVFFSIAALLTGGTVTIKEVNKISVAPFMNILNKIETNFEFSLNDLTVWHGGETLSPIEAEAKPAPGILQTWLPSLILLLTKAHGVSVFTSKRIEGGYGYISDFNRMGTNIDLNEVNLGADKEEGLVEIKVKGPSSLRGTTLDILDASSGISILLAALSANGKSEVRGYDLVERMYENIVEKLVKLGAQIA